MSDSVLSNMVCIASMIPIIVFIVIMAIKGQ